MEQSYPQSDDCESLSQDEELTVQYTNRSQLGRLKWAILHGKKEMVDSILESNTPIDNPCDLYEDYRSPLHSAVYSGDCDIVKKLLDRGASPNVRNKNRETALMLAAKFEKTAIVDLLLSSKRLKNLANNENLTHVHIACMQNRVDAVKKLAKNKSEINATISSKSIRWGGYTPLHFAVVFQCPETVEYLLNAGANITIKDSNHLTALHWADMMRNERIIDEILMAHKNVAQNPTNSEGLSHFHIACTRNNPGIVECFIRNGVTLDDRIPNQSLNWPYFTAIDFAIYYDCVDTVKLLLLEGGREFFPSINVYSYNRIWNAHYTGDVELINLILFRERLKKNNIEEKEWMPSLHHACIHSDTNAVMQKILSTSTEYYKALDWKGNTPLHLAVERGDEKIIMSLFNRGSDCEVKNYAGRSSLHLAFELGNNRIVESFLKNPERITKNPKDSDGLSHFHIACAQDNVQAVARFLELGVDINAPVNFESIFWPGFTPLHFAAKFGSVEVAQMLLEHGASYSVVDKYGMSAFDAAISISEDPRIGRGREFDVMKAILSAHSKSKLDSFNDRGFTLLHLLSWDDEYPAQLEVIEHFVSEHPNEINKAVDILNSPWDGYTPLHSAMSHNTSKSAALLVKYGADIFSQHPNGDFPFHIMSERIDVPSIPLSSADFARMHHNPFGTTGFSLFHVACAAGNIEWMKYFLSHGVDPNQRTTLKGGYEFYDRTALHFLPNYVSGSKIEVTSLLLENGANARARDCQWNTPLHCIYDWSDTKIIDLLVDHGADVNARNTFLETPMISICENRSDNYFHFKDDSLRQKIVSLLNNGADINLADERDLTPLSAHTWNIMFDEFPLTIVTLMKHVVKLRAIGGFISADNNEAYSSLWSRVSHQVKANISDYDDRCKKELTDLMEVRTDSYTTLHSILFKDLNGLSVVCENDELKRIIGSDELHTKFPIYGPSLKLQMKKGQERKRLLLRSKDILKFLVRIHVPRECLDRILQYLTNKDLNSMIKCGNQIQLVKMGTSPRVEGQLEVYYL
ncbi:hypothetical protein QAD02_004428 [Eretmocerus hayati]|uniref:Uncharacterized protein n=1 Tax=Eretmocerus hayati TaxID=131215 RepID=A0ACC2NRE7_9HYME|nr:hypothetical protein QAD02_004428 [Eretmocerus hayati]